MSSFNDFYNIYKSGANKTDEVIRKITSLNVQTLQQTQFRPSKSDKCIVVIPIYREFLTPQEDFNLSNTINIMKDRYDICILCPNRLNTEWLDERFNTKLMFFKVSSFNFTSKESYSGMLERPLFYEPFFRWKYMLIVQLDVWLFNNPTKPLEYFIEKNPIYVGAPWTKEYASKLGINEPASGNGGLSLRDTRRLANILNNSIHKNFKLKTVEDQFITYMLYKEKKMFPAEEAKFFSIDNDPEHWRKSIDNAIPFGIHMPKKEWLEFWKPMIFEDIKCSGKDALLERLNFPRIIISMTSFGDRLKKDAPIVINEILTKQTVKPDLIILTIFKEDELNVPLTLKMMERKNQLEIIVWEENLRPHLKYYPAMLKFPEDIIITIDDDEHYKPDTIEKLLLSYNKHPNNVSALRCHMIKRDAYKQPLPYEKWGFEISGQKEPSHELFATGVGGVLYPPGIFKDAMNTDRMKQMITTDDIYLKELEFQLDVKVVCAYEGRPSSIRYISSLSAKSNRLCDQNKKINNENLKFANLSVNGYEKEKQGNNHLRKIVYTCISGNYDLLREPTYITPGWEYICFTDQKLSSNVWKILPLPEEIAKDITLNQVKRQRIIKINPDKFLGDYDVCIWVDSNLIIKKSLDELCEKFNSDLCVTKHPQRDCIYEESKAIIKYRKDKMKNMQPLIDMYKKEGFPAHFGLNETNIIIRHKNDKVREVMDLWENLLRKYSHRDQMSFNYVLWKLGYKIKNIQPSERDKFFKLCPHKKKK